MAIHSSILAWRIPWMEEPGGLQFTGSQRVGHNSVTSLHLGVTAHMYLTCVNEVHFIITVEIMFAY